MNSTTYIIAGALLIVLGVFGIYHVRDAPGLAFFAAVGMVGGIAMIAKAANKF